MLIMFPGTKKEHNECRYSILFYSYSDIYLYCKVHFIIIINGFLALTAIVNSHTFLVNSNTNGKKPHLSGHNLV